MIGYKKFRPKILPEVIASLFKSPVTIKYPMEKLEMPKDFRGRIIFDSKSCVGCKMCMKDCPAGAIHIEPTEVAKKFKCTFLLDHCLFCAQCVDSCKRNALSTSPQFDLARLKREQFKDTQE